MSYVGAAQRVNPFPAARSVAESRYAEAVSEWQKLAASLANACENAGFDLVAPFSVGAYNASVGAPERLPELPRGDSLGLLVGNTRRLWPVFVHAYEQDRALQEAADPLDTFVTRRLTELFAATSLRSHLVFAHVTQPAAFPIQRLAEAIGFAAIAPSNLAIHPEHGPWFALRAVVVIDCAGPEAVPLLERPCVRCSAPCLPALQRAVASSGPVLNGRTVAAHAEDWLAIRDACPVGRASRYGEAQLRYHYGIDRSRPRLD